MKPSWGCYWAGQWMENIEFAVGQGMELIAVYKPDGQGRGELDRFPSKQDWDGIIPALVNGKYDDIPESAFYMVGTIEEALEKAKKIKE